MNLNEAIAILNKKQHRFSKSARYSFFWEECRFNGQLRADFMRGEGRFVVTQLDFLTEFEAIAIAEKYRREQVIPSSYPLLYGSPGDGEYPTKEE